MTKSIFLFSALPIFIAGYMAGQQLSGPAKIEAGPTGKRLASNSEKQDRQPLQANGASPAAMAVIGKQPAPHEQWAADAAGDDQLRSADMLRQLELQHDEMIASMKNDHLPQEHIERMETIFAAQEDDMKNRSQNIPPPLPQERSPDDTAKELRESLQAAGAPAEAVNDMVSRIEQQSPAVEGGISDDHVPPALAHQKNPA